VHLSGSPGGGRQIKVAATAGGGSGTQIHATGISASVQDEVWLYATNTDPATKKLTLEIGGTTSPDDLLEVSIPGEAGMFWILKGVRLAGTGAAARNITAFCETANVINIGGHVNRLS
jgi:hypothetical protein